MRRREDWRPRLLEFLQARRSTPFVWGASDCFLLAADAIAVMTDEDFIAHLRGYRSRFGALRHLVRGGYRCVAELLEAHFERALRARLGDVILISQPPLDVTLIADGRGATWGQDELGIVRLPLPARYEVWSV